ncbi:HAMP domain-containing sensor histidine kinase [Petroclostridium sp. X23]|uniref:sensor histidine kinase n=1 Tax=Petroclostridium sp. X23 TaxID=3045146 RepID=UPI0024AD6F5B|nr:HAMP domain-containing sensor histidine kinase [Petroclostridium sp. X23]WHH57873.1 HAMP domain-containing sensor histidine kinase [Petroclostridium sp. X23]
MFIKLRNKFLILNLVIISVMMIMAFSSIYLITYNDVRKDIDMELHKISDFYHKSNKSLKEPRDDFDKNGPPSDFDDLQPPRERSVAFTLITDSQWNITTISSIFDMNDEFYQTAKKAMLSKGMNSGNLKLDGNDWAFMITPHFDGYRIVFLDITSQQSILTNLIYTFLVVAAVMLIIIFFISRFFANRSIQPIKEAFDRQKQFVADASHELKTPLSVINTNVDVLLSNGEENINSQSKWLHYIKSEAERMTKLTNDLLYLTQLDYSDIKMIFADFNLSEIVENVILTMEAIIFESNISLDYEIQPNLMTHGNSEQIKQVVMILLDNAIKYTNHKGLINISLKKHFNAIVLSVTNTGEGISEEHIDRIFDRFYRTDKSRARKSGRYGLGLAIAKTIVEQHGGKITAKSVLNQSTTFSVELPIDSQK